MVCLVAWTAEALCAHPMMSQEVPPDQHFETISARNIYIQTRRAIHEFNILQPVSYTHLRAHETRSNLVCRLLLEKKK